MKTKKYKRKNARGILTPNERFFLNNIPKDRFLKSNERHYLSSIRNKTRKGLKDLNLIFKKLPYDRYSLFSEEEMPSLKRPIEEVTKILYNRNHRYLLKTIRAQKMRREPDKQVVCYRTRKQINEIVNSTLNKL